MVLIALEVIVRHENLDLMQQKDADLRSTGRVEGDVHDRVHAREGSSTT